MIDEAPGYKGFGEVVIGDRNIFNFSGEFVYNYYEVMYNIIPESVETAHVEISSEITKTLTARNFAAKRTCTFYNVSKGKNETCTIYFSSVEKANNFTSADFEYEGSRTNIVLGEVETL